MSILAELAVSVFLLIGAAFALLGSYSLARLPNFFQRLHGPTKATTLGVGAILLASSIYWTATQPGWSLNELLIALFLFATAPVSAHLLAKAALHLGVGATRDGPEDRC
jgi:multicomponent K+:H+ antiporter subunit G